MPLPAHPTWSGRGHDPAHNVLVWSAHGHARPAPASHERRQGWRPAFPGKVGASFAQQHGTFTFIIQAVDSR